MENEQGKAVPSEALLAMVEALKDTNRHIERLAEIHPSRRGLWEMGEAYRRAEILTNAIANARPHAEAVADSVQALVRKVFPKLGPWCDGCLQQGEGVCMIHSCVRYPPNAGVTGVTTNGRSVP